MASALCLNCPCCKKNKEGEWFEPIKRNSRSQRHVAPADGASRGDLHGDVRPRRLSAPRMLISSAAFTASEGSSSSDDDDDDDVKAKCSSHPSLADVVRSKEFRRHNYAKIMWSALIEDLDELDDKDILKDPHAPLDVTSLLETSRRNFMSMGSIVMEDDDDEEEKEDGKRNEASEKMAEDEESSDAIEEKEKEEKTSPQSRFTTFGRTTSANEIQDKEEEEDRCKSETDKEKQKHRFSKAIKKGRYTVTGAWNKAFNATSPKSEESGLSRPSLLPPPPPLSSPMERKKAITSIAPLGNNRYFLTASQSNSIIKMWKVKPARVTFEDDSIKKINNSKVEFVSEFKGHSSSGILDLKVLDEKGRFLSAGKDNTIRLWDSRFNCKNIRSGEQERPLTLLATFEPTNSRLVHSIAVLDEGEYVRPIDDIDGAMVKAMARKMFWKGAAAVQRAAAEREIIGCSGVFATASKNDKSVKIWDIGVADKDERNRSSAASRSSGSGGGKKDAAKSKSIAKITLLHELKHDSAIVALVSAGKGEMILTGDTMGVVFLWEKVRSSMVSVQKIWTLIRTFTWMKDKGLYRPVTITKQSISFLSFLENETMFVVGTKSGVLSIWDVDNDKEKVYKNESIKLNVKSEPMTGIHKLPLIKDPTSDKSSPAFSASFEDGFIVSIAMLPNEDGASSYSPFIFHAMDYSSIYHEDDSEIGDVEELNAVTSISTSGQALIAGDMMGGVHTFIPTWSSELGYGDALALDCKQQEG